MPPEEKGAESAVRRTRAYHPLARRAIIMSAVASAGYALAVIAALLAGAIAGRDESTAFTVTLYAAAGIAALMLLVNLAGLVMAVVVLVKHKAWLDGAIALLYNALPLIFMSLLVALVHHAPKEAY